MGGTKPPPALIAWASCWARGDAGAGADAGADADLSTSSRVTLPLSPVGRTTARSTSCSRAVLRIVGDASGARGAGGGPAGAIDTGAPGAAESDTAGPSSI